MFAALSEDIDGAMAASSSAADGAPIEYGLDFGVDFSLVTRDNFTAAADRCEALLRTCAFVSIDCEMTGIKGESTERPALGDLTKQRYERCAKVASKFSLMQVGVCPFHPDGNGGFTASPFTFYVLPDVKTASGPIVMFADTAAFHAENDFDFNAWLKKGVAFLSEAAFEAALARATAEPEPREPRDRVVITNENDKTFFATSIAELRAWYDGDAAEEFIMPDCNAFLRRAFYEELEASFEEAVVESRMIAPPDGGKKTRRMVVMRLDEAAKAERAAAKQATRVAALEERAGFLRIWRALDVCSKPLIGHNCLYDLLFMFHAFEGPLPPTLPEFKAALTKRLPEVWDTKQLGLEAGCSDTSLANLCTDLKARQGTPPVSLAVGFERYSTQQMEHEAGYDAYLTGICFAAFGAMDARPPSCKGKLHLGQSVFSLTLNNLEADAPAEPAVTVLHFEVDGSVEWVRNSDVLQALNPLQRPMRMRWLNNEYGAFITLLPPPHVDAAAGAVPRSPPPPIDLSVIRALVAPLGGTVFTLDEYVAAEEKRMEEEEKEEEAEADEPAAGNKRRREEDAVPPPAKRSWSISETFTTLWKQLSRSES